VTHNHLHQLDPPSNHHHSPPSSSWACMESGSGWLGGMAPGPSPGTGYVEGGR